MVHSGEMIGQRREKIVFPETQGAFSASWLVGVWYSPEA